MDPLAALGTLPGELRATLEDDELRVYAVRDMLHLDADALHDRLSHWTIHTLARELPAAHAGVSFRHASPADPHEASTLDLQEGWLGLEPTFALDLTRARAGDVERFRALVPAFVKLLEGTARPAGFRDVNVGNAE